MAKSRMDLSAFVGKLLEEPRARHPVFESLVAGTVGVSLRLES